MLAGTSGLTRGGTGRSSESEGSNSLFRGMEQQYIDFLQPGPNTSHVSIPSPAASTGTSAQRVSQHAVQGGAGGQQQHRQAASGSGGDGIGCC